MNRILTALVLAGSVPTVWGYDYQAQTGALSYEFFNLSNSKYDVTPYGGGANPDGHWAPSAQTGWGNTSGTVGFFNNVGISGGSCKNPSDQMKDNYIFYGGAGDPVDASTVASFALSSGTSASHTQVEYSQAFSSTLNAPAIGDSWTLKSSSNTIVLSALASAPNMFLSGVNGDGSTSDAYPYCGTKQGIWYNHDIEPTGLVSGDQVWGPLDIKQDKNPLAPSFTTNSLNFNVSHTDSGYIGTGGLWMGLDNKNTDALAVDSLNLAMYPVNLSTYVASNAKSGSQTVAPIYGGHFTLAIGDPFLINSYAAKMLWHLVTDTGYGLSNDSLSSQDIEDIKNRIAPAGADGVFAASSISSKYARWLLSSPSNAVTAIKTMNEAASTPITHESIWGKLIKGVVKLTGAVVAAAAPELIGVEGVVKGAAAEAGSDATATSVTNYAATKIDTAFTSTLSEPAPVSATAPPAVNPTYAASNLLGLLLTNSFVQAEINNKVGLGNPSGQALYANYSIHLGSPACNNISLVNNLFATDMGCGTKSGTAPTYHNVLSLYENSYSSSRLNIWNAILTGADVYVTDSYPQVGTPAFKAFQPPTQVVNLTGAASSVSGVDPAFAYDTGMISIASYSVAGGGSTGQYDKQYAPNLELVKAGDWSQTEWAKPPVQVPQWSETRNPSPGYWFYDTSSGRVTVNGVWIGQGPNPTGGTWAAYGQSFENGPQTLDMSTTCPAGSGVVITATPTGFDTMRGDLSCADTTVPYYVTVAEGAMAPSVDMILASAPPKDSVGFAAPTAGQISYSANTGQLMVSGYQGTDTSGGTMTSRSFVNATAGLTLDLTTCAEGSDVILYLYPTGGQTADKAVGVLACKQGAPVLPYSLCTKDTQATGGVILGLTKDLNSSAVVEFDIGCACIPSYLGGTDPDTAVNATFWQTGSETNGDPIGVMVGATASNPHGRCN
ncbi:MAG: hypothetical protein EOM91_02200 [Sphingobacteriia bacterium]|nr:hypothetical protein [Sphingobacteriia bacterium]NCC38529.1 hypothetical protein [Gammaproteobacteria bacterium]